MAIYYASSTGLSTNSGTYASPWDLQTLLNNLGPGDEGRVLADGTYQPTATYTVGVDGVRGDPVILRGWAADDSGPDQAIIDAANVGSGNHAFYGTIAVDYWWFDHLTVMNAPNSGFGGGTWYNCAFRDCVLKNNGGYGLWLQTYNRIVRCEIIGNTGRGLYITDYNVISNSVIADNGSDGCYANRELVISKTRVTGNTGYGLRCGERSVVELCTISDNTSDGARLEHYTTSAYRNIVAFNGGYGLTGKYANELHETSDIRDNLYWNNTSGAVPAGEWPGENPIYADPQFEDRANKDYRLKAGSPASDVSDGVPTLVGYSNLGAWQHKASGGGDQWPYRRPRLIGV